MYPVNARQVPVPDRRAGAYPQPAQKCRTTGTYRPTGVCDAGIADKLAIPAAYLRRMREQAPALYDQTVNGWLERDDRSFMIRCLRPGNLGELYTGAAGEGAFRDGVRVSPSIKTDLTLAFAGTSQPRSGASRPRWPPRGRQSAAAAQDRRHPQLGPTSWQVADVASGRVDVFWEFGRDLANLRRKPDRSRGRRHRHRRPGQPVDLRLAQFRRRSPRTAPQGHRDRRRRYCGFPARRHDDYAAAGRAHRRPELCFSTA